MAIQEMHTLHQSIAAVLQASQRQLEDCSKHDAVCPRFRGFKNTEDLV